MAEQTEQYGYLFRFDKVIATALHMGGADRILDQDLPHPGLLWY